MFIRGPPSRRNYPSSRRSEHCARGIETGFPLSSLDAPDFGQKCISPQTSHTIPIRNSIPLHVPMPYQQVGNKSVSIQADFAPRSECDSSTPLASTPSLAASTLPSSKFPFLDTYTTKQDVIRGLYATGTMQYSYDTQ